MYKLKNVLMTCATLNNVIDYVQFKFKISPRIRI